MIDLWLRALGYALSPAALAMLALAPAAMYLVARWRAQREPTIDPQLGLKVALGYFGLLGFQLALAGAVLVLYALLAKSGADDRGELARFGMGLLVPGALVLALQLVFARRTNDAQHPGVRRLVLGANLIVTGLLGLAALVAAFEVLFAKGSTGEAGRLATGAMIVYGTAWALCGWRFGREALDARVPEAPPGPPAAATPASPPAPAGPSLPSLGAGFPPLDRET